MKKESLCSLIEDLLPNYIENLTSEETGRVIEEHLDTCAECRMIYEQMTSDMDKASTPPRGELRFLKKVRRTRVIAAVLSIILALLGSYMIYESEYEYVRDEADLSRGITDYMSFNEDDIEAYVLETQVIDGTMFASFRDEENETVNGVAKFLRGINQKYRIVSVKMNSSEYSAVLEYYNVEVDDERYIAVSGYNLPEEARRYALDFSTYSLPGNQSDHREMRSVQFDLKNRQFLQLIHVDDLENMLLDSLEEEVYDYFLTDTSIYDDAGNEIKDGFSLEEGQVQDIRYNLFKAELFILNVLILMVLGFGAIMARYFLTE